MKEYMCLACPGELFGKGTDEFTFHVKRCKLVVHVSACQILWKCSCATGATPPVYIDYDSVKRHCLNSGHSLDDVIWARGWTFDGVVHPTDTELAASLKACLDVFLTPDD